MSKEKTGSSVIKYVIFIVGTAIGFTSYQVGEATDYLTNKIGL